MKEVETIVSEVIPASWSTTLTGALPVNRDWVRDVQQTQLRSFPTAFLLVLILVSWHLRSIRYGLFAMLPTLVPVVVTLGTMGWLGVTLDIGRAMVAAIVIGIGVDDAIHFLSAYKEARERGLLAAEATQEAIETTGRAIVTTSFALSLGFLTLTGSAWQTISSFGFFVSFTIVTALIATLFMLPAMLCTFDNRSEEP
jgi:predicted RND superfamily exporter protein